MLREEALRGKNHKLCGGTTSCVMLRAFGKKGRVREGEEPRSMDVNPEARRTGVRNRQTGRIQDLPGGQPSQHWRNEGAVPPHRRGGKPNVGYTALQTCRSKTHNLELETMRSLERFLRSKERVGS